MECLLFIKRTNYLKMRYDAKRGNKMLIKRDAATFAKYIIIK